MALGRSFNPHVFSCFEGKADLLRRGRFSSGGALGRLCPRAAAAAALALPGPARSAARLPLGSNSSFLHFLNVFCSGPPDRAHFTLRRHLPPDPPRCFSNSRFAADPPVCPS